MIKTIYIVKGSSGDYEDRYEWEVKGFFNEAKANDLLNQLKVLADQTHAKHFLDEDEGTDYSKYSKMEEELYPLLQKLDSRVSISYPGVSYSIDTLDVEVDDE